MRLANAKDQLYSMPLTPDVIWRPARAERLGRVIKQRPESGTLSSWSNVRIILPRPRNGKSPTSSASRSTPRRSRLARRMIGVKVTYVDGAKPDVVVAQYPRGRSRGDGDMTVRLVIGRT